MVKEDSTRPNEMPEMKTSKRKEGANASATLVTYSLQKEAAPKRNSTCEVWRLDPKRFSSWTRLVRVHARVRRVLHNLRSRDDRKAGVELLPEEIKNSEEETVRLAHVKHSWKSTQLRAWVSRYHRKAS